MYRCPDGTKIFLEDEHVVKKLIKVVLRNPPKGIKESFVQFWAKEGGCRTIRIADIAEVK